MASSTASIDAYGDLGLAAYEPALEPKRLEVIDGTHFAPYVEKFEQASTAAAEWFDRHLSPVTTG